MASDPRTEAAATRDQLLEVAERLFAERGYDSVSVREITTEVGANVAAVSYHFGSKRDLYLESVRRAMDSRQADEVWELLANPPRSAVESAAVFVTFVRALMQRMLSGPEPNRCSRLMLQEAAQPSEALDLIVTEFVLPHERALEGLVRRIDPTADEDEVRTAARSLLAQPLHYLVFRAFVEEGSGPRFTEERVIEKTADQVVRVSLRGLGFTKARIDRAFELAAQPS
ncbi:MAG: CerR family C-terminal domain-containing protein [Planctomycetota bacterium]